MPESLEKSVVRLSSCCDRVRRAEGPVQSQDHPPVQFPPELCQSSEITQPSRACAARWVTEHSQISHRCTPQSQPSYSSPYLSHCDQSCNRMPNSRSSAEFESKIYSVGLLVSMCTLRTYEFITLKYHFGHSQYPVSLG